MTGQNPPREWQTEARERLEEEWRKNENYRALIAACPGAGKTFFAVNVADWLLREKIIKLALLIVPTVNIQIQWVETFDRIGIVATKDANNEALRWRRETNVSMIEDKAAIVITYAQLSRDPDLFVELIRRHRTLLIADEVHHADDDETYGKALTKLADHAVRSLALSGTPFNTTGGVLALCETREVIDPTTSKPARETLPTFSYSYGSAIDDSVCRAINFSKISGEGVSTYRSLIDDTLFQRLVSTSRKSDSIGRFLNPDGEYMSQCIREGLSALANMREAGDRRAAMLVVARDVSHGNHMISAIERIKQERMEWMQFRNIQEIYNDSPKAHDRIKALDNDNTDIIVSVRMISEGVDVKRLRVGIYATDWLTRMFFIQFIGRFARYETRLDELQYAVVVVPAHPDLLEWTREVERMILASQIRLEMGGEGPPEATSEHIDTESKATGWDHTWRGTENAYRQEIVEKARQMSPSLRGIADALVMRIASDFGLADSAQSTRQASPPSWRVRNLQITKTIVRHMRANGSESDAELFKRVNIAANNAVGIRSMDKMTSEEALKQRWHFLRGMLIKTVNRINPGLFKDMADVT